MSTTNIILWRHAEAEEGKNDLARALTHKGKAQAKEMSKWLKPRLPKDYHVWVSEAIRSQQTAQALGQKGEIQPTLNPDMPYNRILDLLRKTYWRKHLVIVGHQPWIGQVCAYLCHFRSQPQPMYSIKKSMVFWFEVSTESINNIDAKLKLAIPVQSLSV